MGCPWEDSERRKAIDDKPTKQVVVGDRGKGKRGGGREGGSDVWREASIRSQGLPGAGNSVTAFTQSPAPGKM